MKVNLLSLNSSIIRVFETQFNWQRLSLNVHDWCNALQQRCINTGRRKEGIYSNKNNCWLAGIIFQIYLLVFSILENPSFVWGFCIINLIASSQSSSTLEEDHGPEEDRPEVWVRGRRTGISYLSLSSFGLCCHPYQTNKNKPCQVEISKWISPLVSPTAEEHTKP